MPLSNPLAATVADLTSIQEDLAELEGHVHNRERWFGKLASQTATDWADNTLTPYRAISGNGAYGSDANDEALVWGTADALITLQTKFDLHKILVLAASATTVYKLRIVYGSGTMADAVTAGQYSTIMVMMTGTPVRIAQEEIKMPRLTIGTDQIWIQAWNATNNATIDFFVGAHGYVA
jgi:hypothetical protein